MITEYVVSFYNKDFSKSVYTYGDYGCALYDADLEYSLNKDKYDHYEIAEVITTSKIIKSVKD